MSRMHCKPYKLVVGGVEMEDGGWTICCILAMCMFATI